MITTVPATAIVIAPMRSCSDDRQACTDCAVSRRAVSAIQRPAAPVRSVRGAASRGGTGAPGPGGPAPLGGAAGGPPGTRPPVLGGLGGGGRHRRDARPRRDGGL